MCSCVKPWLLWPWSRHVSRHVLHCTLCSLVRFLPGSRPALPCSLPFHSAFHLAYAARVGVGGQVSRCGRWTQPHQVFGANPRCPRHRLSRRTAVAVVAAALGPSCSRPQSYETVLPVRASRGVGRPQCGRRASTREGWGGRRQVERGSAAGLQAVMRRRRTWASRSGSRRRRRARPSCGGRASPLRACRSPRRGPWG